MNPGPRRNVKDALRALKAAHTLLISATGMPSLTEMERALIEAERATVLASWKRLRKVLAGQEANHVA